MQQFMSKCRSCFTWTCIYASQFLRVRNRERNFPGASTWRLLMRMQSSWGWGFSHTKSFTGENPFLSSIQAVSMWIFVLVVDPRPPFPDGPVCLFTGLLGIWNVLGFRVSCQATREQAHSRSRKGLTCSVLELALLLLMSCSIPSRE